MSGRATGWVLENGPLVRAQRAVLVAIADAADVNGENAYPGMADIAAHSLYGRSQAARIIADLIEAGWLVVEQGGGGRGKATVYSIPGVVRDLGVYSQRKTVRKPDGLPNAKPPDLGSPEPETARSEPKTAPFSRLDQRQRSNERTDTSNEDLPRAATPPPEPSFGQRARAIVAAVHDAKKARNEPVPSSFIGAMKVVEGLLRAGWADAKVQAAAMIVPTISTGWLETELRGRQPTRPENRPVNADTDWEAEKAKAAEHNARYKARMEREAAERQAQSR